MKKIYELPMVKTVKVCGTKSIMDNDIVTSSSTDNHEVTDEPLF